MTQIFSQKGHRYFFDVIVVGSGIAALTYCLEFIRLHPSANIALLTKTALKQSNSYYAQGGIAAALALSREDFEDSIDLHVQDTLNAGGGLSEKTVVETVISCGRDSIEFLQMQGVLFDQDNTGKLHRAQEAGHRTRRIYHAGDKTGAVIIEALIQKLYKHPRVTFFEYHTAINLIHHQQAVFGLYALENLTNFIHTFLAKVIILATGGAGKVYRYTSNADIATGDGVAMAYRAGAHVSHLEFYQFHPTLLYHPEVNNFLLSEALRGEGAYLRLPANGERFMQRYAKETMELATRDIIAQAIFKEIEQSQYDYVYLDIRHQDSAFLKQRFPHIAMTLQQLGLDLSKDLIPVVPAAHYMCGGIKTTIQGKTNIKRLYAIGEIACTGLHGANRLASNSLLEGVIMGRQAAQESVYWLTQSWIIPDNINDWNSAGVIDTRRSLQINSHWRSLRGEMSAYAGIVRTRAGLEDLEGLISLRQSIIEKYYQEHMITRDVIELRNIILVAQLIIKSALIRCESRGNHYREDYPQTSLLNLY